jgi:hypothetical protein
MLPNKEARIRSDAQLARKRCVDRLHHQNKRATNKNQLKSIEQDTAQIREDMRKLVEELRELRTSINCSRGTSYSSTTSDFSSTVENSFITKSFASPDSLEGSQASSADDPCRQDATCPLQQSPMALDSLEGEHLARGNGPELTYTGYVPVVCRCGVPHKSKCECLELSTFTILLNAHSSLSRGICDMKDLPRNASIANMLFLSSDDNPIAAALNFVFGDGQLLDLQSTVAWYYLMYRFLRVSSQSFFDGRWDCS